MHHVDRVAGTLLERLEEQGLLEDTVVLVTGDHGEEFLDNGYFGHTSNFTAAQLAVPFLLRAPGLEPGARRDPTSHLDVPATLLELLGADPAARGDWTLGGNLLEPADPERRRVASGWKELGMWTPGGVLRIPLHDRGSFDIELYSYGWRFLADDGPVLEREAGRLERLAAECNRFLLPSPRTGPFQ